MVKAIIEEGLGVLSQKKRDCNFGLKIIKEVVNAPPLRLFLEATTLVKLH